MKTTPVTFLSTLPLVITLVLSSCGRSGPLYLPKATSQHAVQPVRQSQTNRHSTKYRQHAHRKPSQ